MQLEMTEEERALLLNLLSATLSETRDEIYRTESFEFKMGVKAEKQLILDLLTKLGHPAGQMSHN